MDSVKEIEALKAKRDALEQQLSAPDISEAERIAIRKNIDTVGNEIIEWIKRLPPPPLPPPPSAHEATQEHNSACSPSPLPSPPPPLALMRVCTVCPVLRFFRFVSIADIVDVAHISDTFRDSLESYSATVWRRIAARFKHWSITFFKHNAFAWAAHNILTVGQLDVAVMEEHPLLVAARCCAFDVVRVCIAAMPASVDVRDRNGSTVLHYAAIHGNIECARELVTAGADITLSDGFRSTALHNAAREGKVGVVRLLVAHPDFERIRDQYNGNRCTAVDLTAKDLIKHLLSNEK